MTETISPQKLMNMAKNREKFVKEMEGQASR